MAKAIISLGLAAMIFRWIFGADPEPCAEWSFECPAPPAPVVQAEPTYTG